MWRIGWAIGALAVGLWGAVAYGLAMRRAYRRIREHSTVIPSPYGDIEYETGGTGYPVLVVHGSGGGCDQGAWLAQVLLDERFAWIAPSRFGYLRSTYQPGATFDDQAHAYAHLLDRLGVAQVAVVAISHGGPSALLFALLHPQRVSSLTLISAGVAAAQSAGQVQANQKGDRLTVIFQQDWLYWGMTKLLRRQFMQLMGASAAVVGRLTPLQRQLIDQLVDGMNPVSPRAAGVVFDHQAALPNARIAGIQAPTLVIHATDDTLQLPHHAEFAAATIPRATLLRFEQGGHLLISVEHAAIRAALHTHILQGQNGAMA